MSIQADVINAFVAEFGKQPTYLVRAPGRVNLIGEHTDYNDGFVLPMAINRAVWLALTPTDNDEVFIKSLDFKTPISFRLSDFGKAESSPTEYVKGVAWALQEAGHHLRGFSGVMQGDVPIGAGLSSSAALELAIARAFATIGNIEWDAAAMALLAQKAENQWVGVNSGIMDQMISAAGTAGHALLIDCRSLATEALPLPDGTVAVILDTGTRRSLVGSAYNERRQQCEAAAKHFNVPKLRDVTIAQFDAGHHGLDDVTMRRARHIITENERVLQAKTAMLKGDAQALGKLLDASHVSMRDDFEISSEALNAIVVAAQSHPACYGARMTGGGFAGCGVALVDATQAEDFVQHVTADYTRTTVHTPALYVCDATDGAAIIEQ